MTVGTWDHSDPQYVGREFNTTNLNGLIERKTWNGADRPKLAKRHAPVWRYIWRWNPTLIRPKRAKGRIVLKRRPIGWQRIKIRVFDDTWDPGLVQSKTNSADDQHSYEVTYGRNSGEIVTKDDGYYGADPNRHTTTAYVPSLATAGAGWEPSGSSPSMRMSRWSDNDSIIVLNKLREKLQGSDFNMSVFLGEGHQTLGMIADSAIRIRKALSHLRRGDVAGTARSLLEGTSRSPLRPFSSMPSGRALSAKNTANNWLELQYGWLPLLSDVKAGAEMLAHQLAIKGGVMKVRQSRTVKTQGNQTRYDKSFNVNPYPLPTSYLYRYWRQEFGVLERRSETLYVEERPSVLATLGLTDPTQVIWELMPYSFIADWFIPFGQYLDARGLGELYHGLWIHSQKHYGWTTPVQEIVGTTSATPSGSNEVIAMGSLEGYTLGAGTTSRAHAKTLYYYRQCTTTGPSVPLPSFKPLKQVASWRHCANAVALLVQQFSGKKS